jgi:hypothetical protein
MPLPCVIDIEVSGFVRGSCPIEIGVVLPDGQTMCRPVRPAEGWTHWNGVAKRLHGPTRDLIERHGQPAPAVAAKLNDNLAGIRQPGSTGHWDFAMTPSLPHRRPARLHSLVVQP